MMTKRRLVDSTRAALTASAGVEINVAPVVTDSALRALISASSVARASSYSVRTSCGIWLTSAYS